MYLFSLPCPHQSLPKSSLVPHQGLFLLLQKIAVLVFLFFSCHHRLKSGKVLIFVGTRLFVVKIFLNEPVTLRCDPRRVERQKIDQSTARC